MNQGILKVVFTSEKTIKYIAFKYNLIDWIILNPNFQIKIIKGENSIPNHSTHEICRVHETMAPKKNTQAPSQKTQPSQAHSPHKMLWSHKIGLNIELEKLSIHDSLIKSMIKSMISLIYNL